MFCQDNLVRAGGDGPRVFASGERTIDNSGWQSVVRSADIAPSCDVWLRCSDDARPEIEARLYARVQSARVKVFEGIVRDAPFSLEGSSASVQLTSVRDLPAESFELELGALAQTGPHAVEAWIVTHRGTQGPARWAAGSWGSASPLGALSSARLVATDPAGELRAIPVDQNGRLVVARDSAGWQRYGSGTLTLASGTGSGTTHLAALYRPDTSDRIARVRRFTVSWASGNSGGDLRLSGSRSSAAVTGGTQPGVQRFLDDGSEAPQCSFRYSPSVGTLLGGSLFNFAIAGGAPGSWVWEAEAESPLILQASGHRAFVVSAIRAATLTTAVRLIISIEWEEGPL